jgi:hypothetical protein
MYSAERRMQEGARDLALAFMVGRAEEALSRLSAGEQLGNRDLSYFEQVWGLLSDALEAYAWATTHGSGHAPPPDALRALRVLLPVVRDQATREPPERVFAELADVASSLAQAKPVETGHRAALASALRRIASYAGGQGREAFEAKIPSSSGAPSLSKPIF